MKAVGIIAEYNPLHYGHIYHMDEARKIAGADAVVVAMSGNFVQRGEPAILDKWTRSRHAIYHGADLVIEIPTLFSLGNAGQYAKAGVALLESLGCVESIAFGSESGNIDGLKRLASNLDEHHDEIADSITCLAKTGMSYPAAREKAYKELFSGCEFINEDIEILANPNDILAIEYIRASSNLKPIAVKRKGAGYNSELDEDMEYQSASAIRKCLEHGDDISKYLPEDVLIDLKKSEQCNKDKWFELIRYAVISSDADTIDNCPSGGEGLGNKLKNSIYDANSIEELIMLLKSKKYTYSRISRLLAQMVVGISNCNIMNSKPGYIRILAFNDIGRSLLSQIKKDESNSLPIITNIARESGKLDERAMALVELEAKASDIYNSVSGMNLHLNSDYRRNPTKTDNN